MRPHLFQRLPRSARSLPRHPQWMGGSRSSLVANRWFHALVLASCLGWAGGSPLAAIPLTESTFTEIIHEAKVINAATKAECQATVNAVFKAPDRVRTGRASRVELTAKDKTITRVGANTTFSFAANGREILLEKGGVLFHSPAGAGGGTIKHGGSTAAVLGTTVICQVMPDGSFKVLALEGRVKVTLQNQQSLTLTPGQLVVMNIDGLSHRGVTHFDLASVSSRSLLVAGFAKPVASLPLINAAIQAQPNGRPGRQGGQGGQGGQPPALVPWYAAGAGMDMLSGVLTDFSFRPGGIAEQGNPLDFPGFGPVAPALGGPGGMPLLPPGSLPGTVPPVINPPAVTEMVPQ